MIAPDVLRAWKQNLTVDPRILGTELATAARAGTAVRFHVGGDFLRDGKLDRQYLARLLKAFRRARDAGAVPSAWVYTHAWRTLARHVKYIQRAGIQIFASVHGPKDSAAALTLGYRLAIDYHGAGAPIGTGPYLLMSAQSEATDPLTIVAALRCPEQKLGPEKITCASCGYCSRPPRHGAGHVLFTRH